jgi:transposase
MPGPKPSHQPQFTEAQLVQARQLAQQYTAPFCQVVRARLTLLLAEAPAISNAEAARRLALDEDTVYRWRRRWKEEGWSLEDAPRSGRPRAFSP